MTDVLSRRDLDFLLYEWLDVTSLTCRERFAEHSRETFDAVLELSADIAHKHFATHNKKSDEHEPSMRADGSVEKAFVRLWGESMASDPVLTPCSTSGTLPSAPY